MSRNKQEGVVAHQRANALITIYSTPPARGELEAVEPLLQEAFDKYSDAHADEAGEIELETFFAVVQCQANTKLALGKHDEAIAFLDQALAINILRAGKETELDDFKYAVYFNKANDLVTKHSNADGIDFDDLLAAADAGLAITPNESLSLYKALAHIEKGELDNAVAAYDEIKTNATAIANTKAIYTEQAITALTGGTTFADFVASKDIGNTADDWMTEDDLQVSVLEMIRYQFSPTTAQVRDEAAVADKPTACVLMNSLIGTFADAKTELAAMVGSCSLGDKSVLLGDISSAGAPIDAVDHDFSALTWV